MLTGETKENTIVLLQNIGRTNTCALVTIIQDVVEVGRQLTGNKRKVRVIEFIERAATEDN